MAHEPTRRIRSAWSGWLVGAALLCATPAGAISPDSAPTVMPPGLAPPEGVEPGDPLYLFLSSHDAPLAAEFDLTRRAPSNARHVNFGFRNRQIKLIHYATPVRVAQNDMRIKVDAPGAGRALLSFELEFY